MHNMDRFLKQVGDDVAPVDSSHVKVEKKSKGKAASVNTSSVSSSSASESTSSSSSSAPPFKVERKLNGGVNFILNDIDNAHSMVCSYVPSSSLYTLCRFLNCFS
jgi:hypothetical protein